ncbi:MAG: PKD domain-containing protein [Flavisolibacter sp.]
MKNTIFTVSVMLFLLVQAAAQTTVGRQKVDQYPTSSYGSTTYGLTWLPTDYNSTTQSYPLIIFLHGSGECGDGVSGLTKLISTGLPKKIADGWNPEARNPADGKTYKFIVVSPQAPSSSRWSYTYTHVRKIIEDVKKRYRVDANRIYITGLSAGGAGTWSSVTNDGAFTSTIAAITPVSSVGVNNGSIERPNIPFISGKYGVKVWAICGASDSFYGKDGDYINIINNGNPRPTVQAVRTGIPGAGHSGAAWNTAYDPNWRSNTFNKNMYEWFLQYSRGTTTTPTPTPAPNVAPVANAGADKAISLPTNSVSLTGSGTDADGSISTYNWARISGPTQHTLSNANISNPTLSNLEAGTYVFRLTVRDNANETGTDDISIIVNNSSTPAPNPEPTGSKSVFVNIYNGTGAYNHSQWNNWNLSNRRSNITSGTLKYNDGTTAPVTANLSYSENVSDNKYTTATMAPAEVLRYTSYSGMARTLSLKGLNATKKYTIELYSSRSANTGNNTTFTIESSAKTISTYKNTANAVVFSGISPDDAGSIDIFITKSATYSYLNGFKITEEGTLSIAGSSSVSVSTVNEASQTEIFPNPVTDKFVLKISNSLTGQVKASIFDASGVLKKEFSFQKSQTSNLQTYLGISDLAPGNYVLKTSIGSWSESKQLIKQ